MVVIVDGLDERVKRSTIHEKRHMDFAFVETVSSAEN